MKMKMKKEILTVIVLLITVGITTLADNNFSVELLDTAKPFVTEVITNPRDGWLFFRSGSVNSELEVKGAKNIKVKLIKGEGFTELPAGKYSVSGANTTGLLVRTAPELIFHAMAGDFKSPANIKCTIPTTAGYSGRVGMYIYHWKYLREKILPSFNAVFNNRGIDNPAFDNWRAEGKKVIVQIDITGKPEAQQDKWSERYGRSSNDGIAIDEFILPTIDPKQNTGEFGYLSPGMGFDETTLKAVYSVGRQAQNNNGRFYAWLGVPWNSRTDEVKPLFDVLQKIDGCLLWEAYGYSRNYEKELNNRLIKRTKGFLKANSNAFQSIIVAPSTMEFSDNNANVDYKVWLDRQLNEIANNADFKGVRGLSHWTSHYTEPEILRWYAALFRHYAIEGNREMLSTHYGYKMEPEILQNPEWELQFKNWEINAAATDSIAILPTSQWGFKTAYFPRSKNFLLGMKRVKGKTNSISQKLKNLKKGELYSLKTLVTAKNRTTTEKYAINFILTNCDIVESNLRTMLDFTPSARTNQQCWNAYKIVFKYNGGDAVLTISDIIGSGAGSSTDAVTPEEILIDSIGIAPYFPEQ